MVRLVVIAGPANTGKLPLARKLCADDPGLLLIHRDHIREGLRNPLDEWEITLLMHAMSKYLLAHGHSICICAWNLELSDNLLWHALAGEAGAEMQWLDVRRPTVREMIPPMED